MFKKIKAPLLFVVGLLLGALVTFVIAGKANQRLSARCFSTGLMEQAFIATELRTQRQDDLRKRAEDNLVPAVLAIHQHKELQTVPESQAALRVVKHFYESNDLAAPVEIADILKAVPAAAR